MSTAASKSTSLRLDARESQLKALELTLQADRAEFEAERETWKASKGGGSSKVSDHEVKAEHAKLKALRMQLEDEMSQLKYAQIQQKAAQARLEQAILKFEAAQTQLKDAMRELETAREHLEAAKRQTNINNMRLEAAKASLEASKMLFEAATIDLNDAKIKFEDAKAQLEDATPSIFTSCGSRLEEENNELVNQVRQLESKILKFEGIIRDHEASESKLKKELESKEKTEVALKECRVERERHDAEKFKLKNDKEMLEKELQESKNELERIKKVNVSVEKNNEKQVTFEGVRKGNHVVFFDMEVRGVPVGRIVMELYTDIRPHLAEIFRALCVGERLLPGTERHVGYKGTDIRYVQTGVRIYGGNVSVNNGAELYSVYGNIVASEISNGNAVGPGDVYINTYYNEQPGNAYSFIINGSGGSKIDGSLPLIGRVIQGMAVVDSKSYGISDGWIEKGTMVIADCGQLA